MPANATNYAQTTLNASNYGGQLDNGVEPSLRLLQDGVSFRLLQNGLDKRLLEDVGFSPPATAYTSDTINATNYVAEVAS